VPSRPLDIQEVAYSFGCSLTFRAACENRWLIEKVYPHSFLCECPPCHPSRSPTTRTFLISIARLSPTSSSINARPRILALLPRFASHLLFTRVLGKSHYPTVGLGHCFFCVTWPLSGINLRQRTSPFPQQYMPSLAPLIRRSRFIHSSPPFLGFRFLPQSRRAHIVGPPFIRISQPSPLWPGQF